MSATRPKEHFDEPGKVPWTVWAKVGFIGRRHRRFASRRFGATVVVALASATLWLAPATGSITASAKHDPVVAKTLPELVRQADRAVITYYTEKNKEAKATVLDPRWFERLALALELPQYRPEPFCLCISYPQIELFKKDERLAKLSVHHQEMLNCFTPGFSGNYFVGRAVGEEVMALAMEKQGLVPLPKMTLPPAAALKFEFTLSEIEASPLPLPPQQP